jgi:hypothetical protein
MMGMADFFRRSKPPLLAVVAHNDALSQARIEAALALGSCVVAAVENRTAIILDNSIDSTFAMPAANWGSTGNDYVEAYRMLASLDWNEVRFLRLRISKLLGHQSGHHAPFFRH